MVCCRQTHDHTFDASGRQHGACCAQDPVDSLACQIDYSSKSFHCCLQQVLHGMQRVDMALVCLLVAAFQVTEAFNNTQTEHISFAQVRKFQVGHAHAGEFLCVLC